MAWYADLSACDYFGSEYTLFLSAVGWLERGHPFTCGDRVDQPVMDRLENPAVIGIGEFESIVKRHVIDRLDHKHLNLDCPEFAERIPSIENIAAVIWNLIEGNFGRAHLHRVRAWETPKTYADYFGPAQSQQ